MSGKKSSSSLKHSTGSKSSSSPDSSRTRYIKKMAIAFAMNKEVDNDINEIILRLYVKNIQYKLINALQKVIPFESQIFTNNIVYLALNPHIYSLIPELIKRISHNPKKLLDFYHNLAKNENRAVISFLKKIYEDDPDSNKLNWTALSGNPKAIDILTREYDKYPNKLNWTALSGNPKAIDILTIEYDKNPNNLKWTALSGNPKAIDILTREYDKNPNNLNWKALSGNPNAIKILISEYKKNPNKLDWKALSGNPKAIKIIKKEYKKEPESTKIDWDILSGNPNAIELLRANTAKINWDILSGNPNAIELLRANRTKIDWNILSGNPNPDAIILLKDKVNIVDGLWKNKNINWDILSGNPNAIQLLINRIKIEKGNEHIAGWYPKGPDGPEKYINWERLSANPSIFTINEGPPQLTEQEKLLERQLQRVKKENEEYSRVYSLNQRKKTEELLKKQGSER